MLSKNFIFVDFNNNKTKKTLINKLKRRVKKLFILANLNNSDFYNYFAIMGDNSLKIHIDSKDLEFVYYKDNNVMENDFPLFKIN